jgi:superfamily I DNA/RNA helicase/mRNA-degrading endonuclease RelE of RelBE toxin-antitoxin system
MSVVWKTTMKPGFTAEWLALPQKVATQVLEKIDLLTKDPTPDGHVKKRLKYLGHHLYRIRSGDYRIFYTYEAPFISLLAIRKRQEDTYDEDFEVEQLGGLDPDISQSEVEQTARPDWDQWLQPRVSVVSLLPEPITEELLASLKIPAQYHQQLLQINTEDELTECSEIIPTIYLDSLLDVLYPKTMTQTIQQPDLFLPNGGDDLLRLKEGELIPFLLRLSPEQEQYITWGMQSSGPTLLKGGPGTGKSTIALYRVRALLQEMRKQGQERPRILFTTYTNALVKSSGQLLEQLLEEDLKYVEVQTADKLAIHLLQANGHHPRLLDHGEVRDVLKQASAQTIFEGTPEQLQNQREAITRLSLDYLAEEINQVIIGHQLTTLKDYLAASRTGRRVRITGSQRRAVWSIYTTFQYLLARQHAMTWSQVRALASTLVPGSPLAGSYDAVFIDETQDLEPASVRLLVQLCHHPRYLFLAADANQSIYGSTFSWNTIHTDLQVQGRTSLLQTNHRSTREIGEAAQSYLTNGALEVETTERQYVHTGPQPAVRRISNSGEQSTLLVNYFQQARSYFHLSLSACAVLTPTAQAGKAIAADLSSRGLPATFMSSAELNLKQPGIKVLTLRSAKGLEFPIVALAGFLENSWHAAQSAPVSGEEREELLGLERRAMFVGMTRAMRALLVVLPDWARIPLLSGFAEQYWNLGE